MTTYPPFDALRAHIREARAQGMRVTSPSLATRRFQVIAETVIGPMLRHVAHVLWQEGVPASVIDQLDADPSHVAVRVDEEAVAVYFWASADPISCAGPSTVATDMARPTPSPTTFSRRLTWPRCSNKPWRRCSDSLLPLGNAPFRPLTAPHQAPGTRAITNRDCNQLEAHRRPAIPKEREHV